MPNTISKVTSNENFDYSTLDAETLDFVREQTGEIRLLMKRTAQDIITIGQKLIEIKKRLGHGQYRKWIETEFNWSKSTANSFENVAKRFGNVQILDVFSLSVLYELAAPSTPESARQEAIARAEAGEKIDCKSAKKIKKKHVDRVTKLKSNSVIKLAPVEDIRYDDPSDPVLRKTVAVNSHIASKSNRQLEIKQQKVLSGSWWQLGQNHLMYCGDSHSPQLRTQLPEHIALAISFPPTANWNLGSLKSSVHSSLILFSQYDDIDLKSLREIVRNALEVYTSERETVIFSFLPDPALLILSDRLDCYCIIAEPDPQRCQNVIQAWTQTGGQVKILNSNRAATKYS